MIRKRLERLEAAHNVNREVTAEMIGAFLSEVTGIRDPRAMPDAPKPKRIDPQAARETWAEMFGWDPGPMEFLNHA